MYIFKEEEKSIKKQQKNQQRTFAQESRNIDLLTRMPFLVFVILNQSINELKHELKLKNSIDLIEEKKRNKKSLQLNTMEEHNSWFKGSKVVSTLIAPPMPPKSIITYIVPIINDRITYIWLSMSAFLQAMDGRTSANVCTCKCTHTHTHTHTFL